ncbi:sigma factor-like helix-turn-helix DNA-binding protein [Cohnella caldifontis]|uniref:sigma factor-like helix-turn-helix DNA-binding protein n=1 Tax=Cohnella caldifontis TaxID=3027471 RepID=UPI0023EBC60F|nr:sigma factor-like helix-turn-helix DNA-binding protein [Cohnella sp. YIM B05605]
MNGYRITDLGEATLDNYAATRRSLLRTADDLTVRIASLEPARTMEQLNRLLALEQERRIVIEMISSCSYVIEWLEKGKMPGNRRGIERRAGYQREVLMDADRIAVLRESAGKAGSSPSCGEETRSQVDRVLRILTERERDCFVLAHGEGFTFAEIADFLGISKSSVGTYMTRASRKIALYVGRAGKRAG